MTERVSSIDPTLEPWLDTQLRHSATSMLASISPVSIVKHRPGFGQAVRAVPGSIVASPLLGDWKPDPDYFFHWFRDSAVVIDALRLLYLDGLVGDEALTHLRDFVRFSLALNTLDGRRDAAVPDRRARVAPDFLQYLRDDADLSRAHGDGVAADTRVNPDGTLDITRWARPQHDGPPSRALAMLRWAALPGLDAALQAQLAELIRFDLDFTLSHWREPSFDIWEEERGYHYYTLRVSAGALAEGAAWLQAQGDALRAQRCRDEAHAALSLLDAFWIDDGHGAGQGHYRSRRIGDEWPSFKVLDIAVILSAIHTAGDEWVSRGDDGSTPARPRRAAGTADAHDDDDVQPSQARHTVTDPRMQATLARLEALFDSLYDINRGRPPGHAPAMGRYEGDVYFSGGAWYVSTLAAAEFCFRAAVQGSDAAAWFARGEAHLATMRAHTPPSGDLSEQFDPLTGEPRSAKQLAWSHAAFITCVAARRVAAAALQPPATR